MKYILTLILLLALADNSLSQTTNANDCIKWNKEIKLSLADFKGTFDAIKFKAYQDSLKKRKRVRDSLKTIKVKTNVIALESVFPVIPRFDSTYASCDIIGGFRVDNEIVMYNMSTCFEPSKSYLMSQSDILLENAQIEFDIYEVYTRKMKQMMHYITHKNASEKHISEETGFIRMLCAQDIGKFKRDLLSKNRTNVNAKWRRKVKYELEALNDYTSCSAVMLAKPDTATVIEIGAMGTNETPPPLIEANFNYIGQSEKIPEDDYTKKVLSEIAEILKGKEDLHVTIIPNLDSTDNLSSDDAYHLIYRRAWAILFKLIASPYFVSTDQLSAGTGNLKHRDNSIIFEFSYY